MSKNSSFYPDTYNVVPINIVIVHVAFSPYQFTLPTVYYRALYVVFTQAKAYAKVQGKSQI